MKKFLLDKNGDWNHIEKLDSHYNISLFYEQFKDKK
jgi:hypothetical protein